MPVRLFKRFGFACLCLCLMPFAAHSQSPEDPQSPEDSLWTVPASRIPGSIGIYFFPALPMGDFGDDGENGALATVGAGAGLEYFLPFRGLPLGWMVSAAFAINPVDHEVAADILADQMPSGNVKVEGGRWLNIPLQTGLRVGVSPVPNVRLQAQVLGGVTIVDQAEFTFSSDGYDAKLTPETAFTPGMMLGGGILFFDHLQIGVRFFRTVKTKMKAKFSDSEGEKVDQTGRIATTILAFSLGVQF